MKKILLSLSMFALVTSSLQAQRANEEAVDCQSTEALKEVLKNPTLKASFLEDQAKLEKSLATFKPKKLDNEIVVPVVFHVIHGGGVENVTDDQLIYCVEQMNEDYNNSDVYDFDPTDTWTTDAIPEFAAIKADVGISFALAKKDPDGNSTSGINHYDDANHTVQTNGGEAAMKTKYKWPTNKYMNVYVIRSAGGEAGSAWAYYPGVGSTFDGVTSSYWGVGKSRMATPTHYKIMTHEVGHWANLPHTFDGGCGGNGDGVADTPPCTTGSGCNIYDSPCGVLANRQNYMDYGNCTVMFTEGQKTRMLNAMNGSASGRNNLWTPANLLATGVTGEKISAAYYSYQIMTVPGDTITYHDVSETEAGDIVKWEWEFPGGVPASHVGQTPPPIVYATEGKYSSKLTVTHADGEVDFEEKIDYISVQTDIYMQNATFEVENATLYDPGLKGRYGNRTDATLVLRPKNVGNSLQAEFISLAMEADCNSDFVAVYDGPNTDSPLVGKYCSNNDPGTIVSTHSSGALTFVWHSNVRNRFDGFEANITEISLVPAQPEVDFYGDNLSTCEGGSVKFTDRTKGIPNAWSWEFEGAEPATSTEQYPTVTYNNVGTYKVKLTASNAEGTDSEEKTAYIEVRAKGTLPFSNDFEDVDALDDFIISNPDNAFTFERTTKAGRGSDNGLNMNNAENEAKGQIDELIFQPFSFEGDYESIEFTFDVAYTKYHEGNADELSVFASKDCGATWDNVWKKNNIQLETVDVPRDDSNAWLPTIDSDWRGEKIDLTSYIGESSVILKMHNTTDWGNHIWLDNFNVDGILAVGDQELKNIQVYPNPSSGTFKIDAPELSNNASYQVTDITGKLILNNTLTVGVTSIDLSAYSSGIYMLKITSDKGTSVKKLIKE